jgi:putative oxidoreductase
VTGVSDGRNKRLLGSDGHFAAKPLVTDLFCIVYVFPSMRSKGERSRPWGSKVNMISRLNAPVRKLSNLAPIAPRVILGIIMAWHGFNKFHNGNGITDVKGFFTFLNIPAPGLFAVVVALLELIGGICLILGLLTRVVSLLLIIELLVAVITFKYGKGHVGFIGKDNAAGAELDLAIIAGLIALFVGGAGTMSADHHLALDREHLAA